MTLTQTTDNFSKSHSVWLCDIWGVIHNGVTRFDSAVDALVRHRENGGVVILISNSPRPKPQLIEQLTLLNIGSEAYDGIVSSGDVTRSHVIERSDKRVFHLGPERDKGIFKNIDCQFSAVEQADYIVCSGLIDDTTETPDDYEDLLRSCVSRGLSMICANPDLKVQRGNDLVYCAGSLAQKFEEYGGEVIYAGKPYLPIYEIAVKIASEASNVEIEKNQILAIGDGIHTDCAGAANYSCDFLFIAGGLHRAGNGQKSELSQEEVSQIETDILRVHPSLKLKGISLVLI